MAADGSRPLDDLDHPKPQVQAPAAAATAAWGPGTSPQGPRRPVWRVTLEGSRERAWRGDTYLVDPFERQRLADGRGVPRREALAQAVTDRAVQLVMSALDVNAVLDRVDLNALLDQVDLNALLDQVDLDRWACPDRPQ